MMRTGHRSRRAPPSSPAISRARVVRSHCSDGRPCPPAVRRTRSRSCPPTVVPDHSCRTHLGRAGSSTASTANEQPLALRARAARRIAMADRYDLVIVGMGSGGMVAAEFAATLDLKVAVAERGRVGGDCLWTGCVPSKALLASGKVAHHMRTADDFGIEPVEPTVDRGRSGSASAVQQEIASTDDNPSASTTWASTSCTGRPSSPGPNTVQVGDRHRSRPATSCSAPAAARPSRRSTGSRTPASSPARASSSSRTRRRAS